MTTTPEIVGSVSNDAEKTITTDIPYVATVTIEGCSALLFHRWSVDGVEAKAKAAKGSAAKKSDDIESYVYRNAANELCVPSEYLRMAIIGAAKFKQDPRSHRKSAQDIFKAGVIGLDELCSLGVTAWDYVDRRRVMIQRSGITRQRPAMNSGWSITVPLMVNLPEYISPSFLNEVTQMAGRLIGIGDFRPTFGRFLVVNFKVQQ